MLAMFLALSISNEQIAELQYLVGTWRGEGTCPMGGKFQDEMTYELVQNGNFLRHKYGMWMDGKLVWTDEGILGYDAELKKYVGFTFGQDGTIGRAEGELKDGVLVLDGRSSGPSPFKEYRCTSKKLDRDRVEVSCSVKEGGKYKELLKVVYQRRKP
jgi:hypothetical protein